jgi:radical SAM-linked protein
MAPPRGGASRTNAVASVAAAKRPKLRREAGEKGHAKALSQKWAIRLAIEGDLRFLSHHDVMRATERLLARAGVPVRYSQGFNPRPAMSLAAPRPVGVASQDDLLVLTTDQPITADELLERLNSQALRGMRALGAEEFSGRPPQPRLMRYRTPLDAERSAAVRQRIDELSRQASWPVQRRRESGDQQIDLRPMVAHLEVRQQALHMTLTPRDQSWARPSEVLGLLGLDERIDLAATVRTSVELAGPDGDSAAASTEETDE